MSKTKELTDPRTQASNVPYLVAVIIVFLIATIATVLIEVLKPNNDNSILITIIFGFATTTAPAIMSYMKQIETHKMINSDLQKWIDASVEKAFAEGKISGAKSANERTDFLLNKDK